MKTRLLKILISFLCLLSLLSAQTKKNVAVLDFIAKGVSANEASSLVDMFRTDLVKTAVFNVLDRNNMDKILNEQSFQQSGCTDTACAVQLGKLLNMQFMFSGSLSKFGETYIINIDMINVETGKIEYSEKGQRDKLDGLIEVSSLLANYFSQQIRTGGKAVAPDELNENKKTDPAPPATYPVTSYQTKKIDWNKAASAYKKNAKIYYVTGGSFALLAPVSYLLGNKFYKDYNNLGPDSDFASARLKVTIFDNTALGLGIGGASFMLLGVLYTALQKSARKKAVKQTRCLSINPVALFGSNESRLGFQLIF